MATIDPVLLMIHMHQQEIRSFAEKQRMIKRIPHDQSYKRIPGSQVIDWLRTRLTKENSLESDACTSHYSSINSLH